MNVLKKNIGLTFDGDEWHFRLWAPQAKKVQLLLPDRDQTIDLIRKDYGYWAASTTAISENELYWVLLDDKKLPDPASVSQPDGVHGASQAINLHTIPQLKHWQNIPLKDYILYELHTGTFTAGGDFEGIAEKLDYLVELGITAIELMPLAAFAGERNWGYDGVLPFAVQASYGGPKRLQQLVELCHSKGLAVVLDVVYNHFGPEGNYLHEFGPYFTDKYKTPWGKAVNFDDRGSHGVREYIVENAIMWFRDFHIDALRLDAVHAIKDNSAVHILQQISKHTDLLSKQTGKPYYLIAECDLNDPRYISPVAQNGLGMHGQWVDEFHHALRVAAGEPKIGYYSDFDGIAHLGKSYADAYVYTGMYSEERDNFFGKSAHGHHGSQFVVFSQNHDQVGNRMLGERSSTLLSFEMQKLLAAAVITSPFVPMLFMGEEWAAPNPFLYFVDHTDPELIEAVRKGRREEFAASHLEGQAPDPKAEDTFNRSKLSWQLLQQPQHATMFKFYQHLIALRKQYRMLQTAHLATVHAHVFQAQNSLMIERKCPEENNSVLCVLNFSSSVQQLAIPAHLSIGEKLLNTAEERWMGPVSASENIADLSAHLTVQPESFIAYTTFYD
jgi:maltooligosyltrehalose trehalohydrolase